MAANDYFSNWQTHEFEASLRPSISHNTSQNPSRTDLDSVYAGYEDPPRIESATPAPSYRTYENAGSRLDPPRMYQSAESSGTHLDDSYADDIPLQPSKFKTTPVQTQWQTQDTRYPPSPESQPGPNLFPPPTPTKKKGFFSGKIAWVVFITSGVQFAVFIAEIIKNGK